MIRYVAIGLATIALISVVGVWLFHRAGQNEAIRDAKDQTRIAAQGSVEPTLSDGLLREKPSALAAVDRVIQERVLTDDAIARVKIWDSSGRIVYSDEPALIGKRYPLGADEREDFGNGRVTAEVTATNPTSSAKSYVVQVDFRDQSGNLLDTTVVTLDDVPAGGSKNATARSNRSLTGDVKTDVARAARH